MAAIFDLFFGIDIIAETQVNLGRAVKEWCSMMELSRQHNKNLNVRIFETLRDEFSGDV